MTLIGVYAKTQNFDEMVCKEDAPRLAPTPVLSCEGGTDENKSNGTSKMNNDHHSQPHPGWTCGATS